MSRLRFSLAILFAGILIAISSIPSYGRSSRNHAAAPEGQRSTSKATHGAAPKNARSGASKRPSTGVKTSTKTAAKLGAKSGAMRGSSKTNRASAEKTSRGATGASAKVSARSNRRGHGKRGAAPAPSSSHKMHGQQAIAPERVTQIQQALIREHYLSGEANGSWDSETVAAMQKWQKDHGWQTRLMPDSRALKTLGLGPDYSGAINASGSSFAAPAPASTIPAPQVDGFAAAAGVKK